MRGVTLPPRGSLQDVILREMVQRERFEEFQKTRFLGQILAAAFGLNNAQYARLEHLLDLSIFHTAYNPSKIQEQMELALLQERKEREKRQKDALLLKKVASYDKNETEDTSEAFKTALDTRHLRGIKNPWEENT